MLWGGSDCRFYPYTPVVRREKINSGPYTELHVTGNYLNNSYAAVTISIDEKEMLHGCNLNNRCQRNDTI